MYVQRDEANRVKGVYRLRQPGVAEEELPDDHPDIAAFRAPPPLSPVQRRAQEYRGASGGDTALLVELLETVVEQIASVTPANDRMPEFAALLARVVAAKARAPGGRA